MGKKLSVGRHTFFIMSTIYEKSKPDFNRLQSGLGIQKSNHLETGHKSARFFQMGLGFWGVNFWDPNCSLMIIICLDYPCSVIIKFITQPWTKILKFY